MKETLSFIGGAFYRRTTQQRKIQTRFGACLYVVVSSDASAVKILFVSKESGPLNIYLQSNRSAMIF